MLACYFWWMTVLCLTSNYLPSQQFQLDLGPIYPLELCPLVRHTNTKPGHCLFLLREATMGRSHGGVCFLISPCQTASLLSITSLSLLMSVWLRGSSLLGYLAWLSSGLIQCSTPPAPPNVTTTAASSSSNHCFPIEWSPIFSLFHGAWNTSFYVGIGRFLNSWCDPDFAH